MALKLNLTKDEANSKARGFDVPPTGSYLCNIFKVTERSVKEGSKNAGKPYWNIEFIIDQDGDTKYNGRHLFSNVMVFEGAAYNIKQLVESVFPDMISDDGELTVPDPEAFEGKQVVVVGIKHPQGSKEKKSNRVRERDEFEVKGFQPANAAVVKTATNSSLLP